LISPRQQWAIQIDVTNTCPRRCSNCTRLIAHQLDSRHWFMPHDRFRQAVLAVRDFLTDSQPDAHGRPKLIGVIGGEPLLHPGFDALCRILADLVPDKEARGLWTGLPRESRAYQRFALLIDATFGYVNRNYHDPAAMAREGLPAGDCYHQPVLAAARELAPNRAAMWRWIEGCWLNRLWASAVTPKGFFFCEVAAALDAVFEGPGGLPVAPGCWDWPLEGYAEQIERWCPRCGVCVPLPGRLDRDEIDDVTPGALLELCQLGSPRALGGRCRLVTAAGCADWKPEHYLR